MQIYQWHIHDVNVLFQYIPKGMYWMYLFELNMEAIWVQETNCRVQETILRIFDLAENTHQMTGMLWSQRDGQRQQ